MLVIVYFVMKGYKGGSPQRKALYIMHVDDDKRPPYHHLYTLSADCSVGNRSTVIDHRYGA